MAAKTVKCAKLGQDLPAIDPQSADGDRALRLALLVGGPEMKQRICDSVSAQAWEMWTDYMRMVINEYGLDPTSDRANEVLRPHMEDFFFGQQRQVPGYTPPQE